jgi:RNA polymerase sigma factor (sigma-70 family)
VTDTAADRPLEELAARAVGGDRDALEQLCRRIQHPVYRLALRMTGHPHDAADAAQEAMIRIVTHLGQYEGRSAFLTWAYAVAARTLLTARRRAAEASVRGPAAFAAFLDRHRDDGAPSPESSAEYAELCADVRFSCTSGMLLCLSRPLRLAYLLGDLMGMTDVEGAAICDTTPAAYRQRLARARATMRGVIADRCGLVRATNPCRCTKLVAASVGTGLLDPQAPVFARHPGAGGQVDVDTIARAADQLDLAVALAEVFRTDPDWLAPADVWAGLQRACPDLL